MVLSSRKQDVSLFGFFFFLFLLVNVGRFGPQGVRVPLCLFTAQSCRCACDHKRVGLFLPDFQCDYMRACLCIYACMCNGSHALSRRNSHVDRVIKADISHVHIHGVHPTLADTSQFTSV